MIAECLKTVANSATAPTPQISAGITPSTGRLKSGECGTWGGATVRVGSRDGEVSECARLGNIRLDAQVAYGFGVSDEDNYAPGLDRVMEIEIFFLAYMY